MAISKKTRVAVYKKFDGHCAYCGRHIAYNNMQVDHFKPQRAWNPEDSGTDGIENLMPSCRMCNHYKRAHDLETFNGSWEACSSCAWESRWAASQYKYCPHCGKRMVNTDE